MSRIWTHSTPEQRIGAVSGAVWLGFGAAGLAGAAGTPVGPFDVGAFPSIAHAVLGIALAWAAVAGPGPARVSVVAVGTALAFLGALDAASDVVALATVHLVGAWVLLEVTVSGIFGRRRDGLLPAGSIASVTRRPAEDAVVVELNALRKHELYAIARDLDVPGRSRMSKRELVDALERAA
jgi:hypothetical protein